MLASVFGVVVCVGVCDGGCGVCVGICVWGFGVRFCLRAGLWFVFLSVCGRMGSGTRRLGSYTDDRFPRWMLKMAIGLICG